MNPLDLQPWWLNLQLWGVVGTWVASIGTVAAVISSIWFASRQNKVKLSIWMGERLLFPAPDGQSAAHYVLEVVNTGTRSVQICSITLHLRKFKLRKFRKVVSRVSAFIGSKFWDCMLGDLPLMLPEGGSAHFTRPIDAYDNQLAEAVLRMCRTERDKSLKHLVVGVHTSVGKSFYVAPEAKMIENLRAALAKMPAKE